MIPMNGIWPPTAWRILTPNFPPTVEPGDIIVGGANFGCGSSREHASSSRPAESSASSLPPLPGFFYRNAINIGFPIMECPEAAASIKPGDQVSVDFSTGKIIDETTGKTFQAAPFPEFIQGIGIENGGLMNSLKAGAWPSKQGV